ncbi:hypothetical protein SUDANB126_03577 [Streptomyces sp. enrichment culture]
MRGVRRPRAEHPSAARTHRSPASGGKDRDRWRGTVTTRSTGFRTVRTGRKRLCRSAAPEDLPERRSCPRQSASGRYTRFPLAANSFAFCAMPSSISARLPPCSRRMSCEIFIEQNFGPHIEQK